MRVSSIRQGFVWVLGLVILGACGEAPVAPHLGPENENGEPLSVSKDIVISPNGPQASDCFGEFECPIEAEEIKVTISGGGSVSCIVCTPSGTVGSGGQTGGTGSFPGGVGSSGGSSGDGGDDDGTEFTDYTVVSCDGKSRVKKVVGFAWQAEYLAETNCTKKVDDILHVMFVSFKTTSGATTSLPSKKFSKTSDPTNFTSQVKLKVTGDGLLRGQTDHKMNFLSNLVPFPIPAQGRESFTTRDSLNYTS